MEHLTKHDALLSSIHRLEFSKVTARFAESFNSQKRDANILLVLQEHQFLCSMRDYIPPSLK